MLTSACESQRSTEGRDVAEGAEGTEVNISNISNISDVGYIMFQGYNGEITFEVFLTLSWFF